MKTTVENGDFEPNFFGCKKKKEKAPKRFKDFLERE